MTLETQTYGAAGPGAAGLDASGVPPGAAQAWQDAMGRAGRTQLVDAGGDWAKLLPPSVVDAAAEAAPSAGLAARALPLLGGAAGVAGLAAAASRLDAARADGQVADAMGKFGLDPASPADAAAAGAYVWGRNMAPMAYADVPWSGPGNEAVAQALMRHEQAHPGTLAQAQRGGPAAGAAVDQVVAEALRPSGPPAAADAGGAGGKLPPGPPGRVRGDGECDEDSSVGTLSQAVRLPGEKTGDWLGEVGNSAWQSANPAVNAVTGGKPIPFVNNRPDFTQWSTTSINFRSGELTGNSKIDRSMTTKALSANNPQRFPTARDADKWLRANKLTPHHANDTCIQLVPTDLNKYLSHIGGAADIKDQRSLP